VYILLFMQRDANSQPLKNQRSERTI